MLRWRVAPACQAEGAMVDWRAWLLGFVVGMLLGRLLSQSDERGEVRRLRGELKKLQSKSSWR